MELLPLLLLLYILYFQDISALLLLLYTQQVFQDFVTQNTAFFQKVQLFQTYARDKAMNCGPGNCLDTASGYQLSDKDEFKIVACPKTFKFGTKFEIQDVGIVVCEDRGGAIKGKRLDLWAGIGDQGITNIHTRTETSGKKRVWQLL